MNIPFPIIYPHMICPDWFNSDRPYDEDAELTRMEQANQRWLNSVAKKYMKHTPIEKPNPEPMEEAETDDDVFIVTGNDDPEESEESHDVDEVEEIPTTTTTTTTTIDDSPPTNLDGEPESLTESPEEESPEEESPGEVSPADTDDLEVEATLWPYEAQDE
ncbi:anaphase-promoting complex subunit 15-like [Vanessa tameamea]|uniref:Anaphase-promoting complex subunit 15-like n=1 Tax=Vanessa tameamea TaxID=334116 RepID=A0ABM4AYN6_VANTA|nr:anaphase-promoting complex subunit 15-like [Vanessa atalanta]